MKYGPNPREYDDIVVSYAVKGQTPRDREYGNGYFWILERDYQNILGKDAPDSIAEAQVVIARLKEDPKRFQDAVWWIERWTETTHTNIEVFEEA